MIKGIQYCEFRATSVFPGKRKLLKTPEYKECIQYNELGNSVFQGKSSCSKILNGKNIFNTVIIFREILFSGQAQAAKNPECKKYIQYCENFRAPLFFQDKRKLFKNRER